MDWPIESIIHMTPLIGIAATIFWIWLLIHCLKNPRLGNWKIPWFLFIIFSNGLGAVIYFFIHVLPGSALSRWFMRRFQSSPSSQSSMPYYQPSRQSPPQQPVYPSNEYSTYQPSTQQGYQSYKAGYQAQSPQYPPYPTVPSVPSAMPQEEQTYSSYDYEQPQTMYPELPPQQQ